MNKQMATTVFAASLILALPTLYAEEPELSPPGRGAGTGPATQMDQADQQVYGWQLMTPEERAQYRETMRSLRTQEEREQFRREHHAQMQERAREQGLTLPDQPMPRGSGRGAPGTGAGESPMDGRGPGGGRGR